jgi:hypothetical protein
MEFIIDKLSDLEIVKITVSGKLNQDIRKSLLSRAGSILNTNGYQKLLVDATGSKVSKSDMARTNHMLDVADAIKKIETKKHTQIAVLIKDREDDGRKDFSKLAQFLGKVHMKHFKNYDEAITWLLGGKDIFT